MSTTSGTIPQRVRYHRIPRSIQELSKEQDGYTRGSMVTTGGRTRDELCHTRGTYIDYSQKTLKIHHHYPQMNMISHLIKKYIYNDEQKLALKIAIASFFILFWILSMIIWSSYIYQRNSEYREFQAENQLIEDRDIFSENTGNISVAPPN